MAGRRRKAEWECDKAFMNIARVAWPNDVRTAQAGPAGYGPDYSKRQAARSRLKLRWEGFNYMPLVKEQVTALQRAVGTMSSRVSGILSSIEQPDEQARNETTQ